MTHRAIKVVIITEAVISKNVAEIIDRCGASGYTITPAGGKGSRGVRTQDQSSAFETSSNVKIEIITVDRDVAEDIANQVTEAYFDNYAGITYLEGVEILRPEKFSH